MVVVGITGDNSPTDVLPADVKPPNAADMPKIVGEHWKDLKSKFAEDPLLQEKYWNLLRPPMELEQLLVPVCDRIDQHDMLIMPADTIHRGKHLDEQDRCVLFLMLCFGDTAYDGDQVHSLDMHGKCLFSALSLN